MSNDKTTLAGVLPGGRVRLGDGLPPLPKAGYVTGGDFGHEAHNAFTPEQMREYALAALSAQPSPGGQEVLTRFRCGGYDASDEASEENTGGPIMIADPDGEWVRAADVLAARQPVGEPAYNSARISLTACQMHEALLMAGDPELDVPFEDRSLVRIFWTETGHSGPGLYCECVDAEEEGCILLDGTAPAIGQSAQAVDPAPDSIPNTPEVRDILGRPNFWCSPWANVLRMRGDEIPNKAEEEQAAVIRFMLNHYLANGTAWAETAGAELDAIRKVDGKAVGNG